MIIETIWFLSGIFFFTNPGNKYYILFRSAAGILRLAIAPIAEARSVLGPWAMFPDTDRKKNNYHCANLQAARSNPVDVRPTLVKRLLVTFEPKIEIKAGIFLH